LFRRAASTGGDTTDATHSANFHQLECLYVDRNVTVRDLKALLDYIFASLLGPDTKTRFRPHYFGYTEPSFEVDLTANHLPKVKKEWIEIGGCGMVDPTVFEAVGYDAEEWSGYAFGMGLGASPCSSTASMTSAISTKTTCGS